jgi:hypothetical protein
MPDYALLLSTVTDGFQADITKTAQDWERATRLQGGFWQGTFRVEDKIATLQEWFYNRLGWQVQERSNKGITWEGLIYEMELTTNGVTRRRSLDTIGNELLWDHGNSWSSTTLRNEESIRRYGTKQNYLGARGDFLDPPTNELASSAWPWARAIGIAPREKDSYLDVTVCGYIFTLNWRYVFSNWWDPTKYWTVGEWIADELGRNRGDFLVLGDVKANTLPIQKYMLGRERVWDFLQELTAMGDAAGKPWRIWVGPGRRVHYGPVDLTVRGYLRGGTVHTSVGGIANLAPRSLAPGVIRDTEYPRERSEPGSVLADARDLLVEEVQVDAENRLSLRTTFTTDADILIAQGQRRGEDDERLANLWRTAFDADLEKRRLRWEGRYPGVPFDPTKDQH